jgi:plastocyanin
MREMMKSNGTGRMTRREALAAMAVTAVAACTSDRPTGENGDGDVEVEMTNALTFVPATRNISVGDTVTFRNTSTGIAHTATCDPAKAANASNVSLPQGAAAWDTGTIGAGGTRNITFTVAGQYRYVCLPHEASNMFGTINVS